MGLTDLNKQIFERAYFYRKMTPEIHLTINSFCNNKCSYCGTYNISGEISFHLLYKILKFIKTSGRNYFFLEGGEPTLSSNFFIVLDLAKKFGLKVVLLTNGRVPRNIFLRLKEYLGNVIFRVVVHAPIGREPFFSDWINDVYCFLTYLSSIKQNIDIKLIGVLWSPKITIRDILFLYYVYNKYNLFINSIGFCFPHRGLYGKHYMTYNDRLSLLPTLLDFVYFCRKKGVDVFTDFMMGCLLEDAYKKGFFDKYVNLYDFLIKKNVPSTRYYEIHIGKNGKLTLINSLSKSSYISIDFGIYKFKDFRSLEYFLEKEAVKLISRKKMPRKCLECKFFLNSCRGDHFNLISELEKNEA